MCWREGSRDISGKHKKLCATSTRKDPRTCECRGFMSSLRVVWGVGMGMASQMGKLLINWVYQ